ncbi:hypothetical protein ATN84_03615 [Paramesorhizobium deserti]|uniref:DUF1127 domain-containing protein n=1 Tax=Paramesorhizobium deserti TaxID=1494590 RepID=A0A135I0A7_9HYPH|nr:DUF1127 domain-containing protein [Paramesorhizobium deserti]KXF78861.1 hypothetical protein ATN84_03615 [Paramesorhizobium deserti]
MDAQKRHRGTVLPKRLRAFLTFSREEAARRRMLADILDKHDDHWLNDVGLSRDEARRILKRSFIRRLMEWWRTNRK